MSTRIQEVYSLSAWYQDVLHRYEQLAKWTSGSLATPHSVWISGLFNPKAFLTAVSTCFRPAAASCMLKPGTHSIHGEQYSRVWCDDVLEWYWCATAGAGGRGGSNPCVLLLG